MFFLCLAKYHLYNFFRGTFVFLGFVAESGKMIKARIAQREREKRANGTVPETGIGDNGIMNSSEVVIDRITEKNYENNGHLAPKMQLSGSTTKQKMQIHLIHRVAV